MKKGLQGMVIVWLALSLAGCGAFWKEYEPRPVIPTSERP